MMKPVATLQTLILFFSIQTHKYAYIMNSASFVCFKGKSATFNSIKSKMFVATAKFPDKSIKINIQKFVKAKMPLSTV